MSHADRDAQFQRRSPTSRDLLIVADGAGSNGARNRRWEQQVPYLEKETGLTIPVCHLPAASINGTRSSIGSFLPCPSLGVGSRS